MRLPERVGVLDKSTRYVPRRPVLSDLETDMALTSTATAHWEGSLFEGKGSVNLDSSGLGSFDINWKARSEGAASTTTPEELLGAAHAACFSMAFSNGLAKANTP